MFVGITSTFTLCCWICFCRAYSFRRRCLYTWNSPLPAPALEPITFRTNDGVSETPLPLRFLDVNDGIITSFCCKYYKAITMWNALNFGNFNVQFHTGFFINRSNLIRCISVGVRATNFGFSSFGFFSSTFSSILANLLWISNVWKKKFCTNSTDLVFIFNFTLQVIRFETSNLASVNTSTRTSTGLFFSVFQHITNSKRWICVCYFMNKKKRLRNWKWIMFFSF